MSEVAELDRVETVARAAPLAERPEQVVALTTTEKFSFDPDDLAAFHLAALRKRFEELIGSVPVLARVAETQGVKEIRSIEDGALLLLPHTIYKSYPLAAIEQGRFDRMTKWLGTLTAHDLSQVDSKSCDTIDSWVDQMDRNSEVRLRHSSGTTGKLSFVPSSAREAYTGAMGIMRFLQGFGDEPDAGLEPSDVAKMPLICFGYRRGASATARTLDAIQKYVYNDDASMVLASEPGAVSADVLSLGGRLEGAQARGELGKLSLAPSLLARRDEFVADQANRPERQRAFLEMIAERFRGQPVFLKAVLPLIVDAAIAGTELGQQGLFSPNSVQMIAGGPKGRSLPDDYPAILARWSGAAYPRPGYGMSEASTALTRLCPAGHYHIAPNLIPYLLDPKSGAPLPRVGVQKGRYGIIDVGAQFRWGGFLTSDEVTLHWGDLTPCSCGRKGAYIEPDIRRYSESEGGDDKITCAGTPGVHDKALQFIADALD